MRALVFAISALLLASPAWAQNQPDKPKRNPNVITLDEISAIQSEAANAYEIIQRLRPQFLRARGGNRPVNPVEDSTVIRVVIDNSGRGGLDALNQIPSNTIKEIRWLNGTDASIQFGTNYGAGAILISTR